MKRYPEQVWCRSCDTLTRERPTHMSSGGFPAKRPSREAGLGFVLSTIRGRQGPAHQGQSSSLSSSKAWRRMQMLDKHCAYVAAAHQRSHRRSFERTLNRIDTWFCPYHSCRRFMPPPPANPSCDKFTSSRLYVVLEWITPKQRHLTEMRINARQFSSVTPTHAALDVHQTVCSDDGTTYSSAKAWYIIDASYVYQLESIMRQRNVSPDLSHTEMERVLLDTASQCSVSKHQPFS